MSRGTRSGGAAVRGRVAIALAAGGALVAGAGWAVPQERLLVYAGAGFRLPIEAAAQEFSRQEEIRVEATFAGSGCLLAQAEIAGHGDVFIPGELYYVNQACERKVAGDPVPLAYLRPVIAVREGNPFRITGPGDLAAEGLRLGLGDPASVAVGMAGEKWLAAALDRPVLDELHDNVITRAINVNELGTQVVLGGIDAAVVWDATVPLFDGLEAVVSESSHEHRTVITGAILEMSEQRETARAFLDFLSGPEGQSVFRRHGYEPFGSARPALTTATR